jgi:inosine/xanthosine triphosphatase
MKVIITTTNKAKKQALQDVFSPIWTISEYISEKFDSQVSEQPMSEQEGIQGAQNRVHKGRTQYPDADFVIGMEGFVDQTKHGMFLGGCVIIQDKNKTEGIGISAKIQLPSWIGTALKNGEELGPLIQKYKQDNDDKIRHQEGTNGILTNGLYTRVDEFKDATKCAVAKFQNPHLYQHQPQTDTIY